MSSSPSPVRQGYLLLADISGYTSFLTQTELDHSEEFLADRLETMDELILREARPSWTPGSRRQSSALAGLSR